MKLSTIALAALVSISPIAFAKSSNPAVQGTNAAVSYEYGTELDIKRVISLTDTRDQEGVVPATMVYEDSNGAVKVIQYRELGGAGKAG